MELLSDIARLNIKQDSYNSMIVCDIVSRIEQKETKTNVYKKKEKKVIYNEVKRGCKNR